VSACRDLSYADFGGRLLRACGRERVPLSGSIELTFRCNLRCVHCYVPDYSGRGEMGTAEVTRILDEIAGAGCLWLLLTGGEILCRSDFPDIYRHAKRRGFLLTLFSNGTLVDERVADLLAEYPPFGIEFTLYGLSDATYERTTGFPGRFARVRRAIDLLLERGLPLTLKAVAMEPLADEIDAMREFAAGLGVHFRWDAMVHARLDGNAAPTGLRQAPERVAALDAAEPERLDEWLRFYRKFVAAPPPPTTYLMSCGAGVNSFHVDPKGTLLACEALPMHGYDLRRGTFREGWDGIVAALRRREAAPANACVRCELKSMCDRCPATALLETGSPDGWIPYYCEVTHRRAALLAGRLGDTERAAAYAAHADRVAAGWTPPGAILPRGDGRQAVAGAACGAAGGCASGGCGRAAPGAAAGGPALLVIDRPRA
jgi:radical SAM protein with 4Fe4S-binding SPASM domain